MSIPQAVEFIAQVSEAAHYAHRRGYVHRDLKPANILLACNAADDDETESVPQVRIADFGLAVHEDVQRLYAGERSGTLHYMAPEQILGNVGCLDGRTDVWALGVMLYEMCCGRRPFRGSTAKDVEEEILQKNPRPPRQIRDNIPEEIQRICLKCLSKEMTDRYSTARDLARDLRRWQQPSRRWLYLLAALMAIALTIWLWLRPPGSGNTVPTTGPSTTSRPASQPTTDPSTSPSSSTSQPSSADPSPPEAISGTLDVLVWSESDPSRRGLRLRDPGALPLRAGDQIRIEAKLNRPAYAYLVWIDASGAAAPVYPWQGGDWSARPGQEQPVERLSLPDIGDQGWPVKPPLGTETLILLARDTILPTHVQLSEILGALPDQLMRDPQNAIWFADGMLLGEEADRVRGVDLGQTQTIDDSVLKAHRRLDERLAGFFKLRRAVSFASRDSR